MEIYTKVAKFELGEKDDVRTLRHKQKTKAIIKLASRIWKFFKNQKSYQKFMVESSLPYNEVG